jgi:two-component system, LuxR family, response regulator FixJ
MNDATQKGKSAAECFIADDEPLVRDTLSLVLSLAGFHVSAFADGSALVRAGKTRVPACIILDVNMPGSSGLTILKELNAEKYPAPIFLISGAGDIPMAVEAMKYGAHDFIEKPFDPKDVVVRVRGAIDAWAQRSETDANVLAKHFPGRDELTPRERDVLVQIATGASNKEVGRTLAISPRTVEIHRARILDKVGAKNVTDLVRIVLSEQPALKRANG